MKKNKAEYVLIRWTKDAQYGNRENELAAVPAERWESYRKGVYEKDPYGWVEVIRGPRQLMETYERMTKEKDDE